jgi:hypothetical protein
VNTMSEVVIEIGDIRADKVRAFCLHAVREQLSQKKFSN